VGAPPHEEETTVEIHYGPRGLHEELEARIDRLITERRRTRRLRRAERPAPR
jgi:hypothetical protein